jgi:hypothetical protein
VYDDNPNSLHNLKITMKKICKVKGKGKTAIKPKVWAAAMTKKFKDPMVKKVCLCLANTPVFTMFKELNLLQGTRLRQDRHHYNLDRSLPHPWPNSRYRSNTPGSDHSQTQIQTPNYQSKITRINLHGKVHF